ncbi:MAG: hypothetical protein AABX35_02735 [Nanoarchaeota archaeon]
MNKMKFSKISNIHSIRMDKRGFSLAWDQGGAMFIVVAVGVIIIGGLTYLILTGKLPALLEALNEIFGRS